MIDTYKSNKSQPYFLVGKETRRLTVQELPIIILPLQLRIGVQTQCLVM